MSDRPRLGVQGNGALTLRSHLASSADTYEHYAADLRRELGWFRSQDFTDATTSEELWSATYAVLQRFVTRIDLIADELEREAVHARKRSSLRDVNDEPRPESLHHGFPV